MNPFKFICDIYWRLIATPEKYARHIGVHIGNNCLIATTAVRRNFTIK